MDTEQILQSFKRRASDEIMEAMNKNQKNWDILTNCAQMIADDRCTIDGRNPTSDSDVMITLIVLYCSHEDTLKSVISSLIPTTHQVRVDGRELTIDL